jgi:predicted dehydrogenase
VKKKIALIGAGVMGANHARTVSNSTDFELAVVIDSDIQRARALSEKYNAKFSDQFEGALNCDASIIATNTESHFQTAEKLIAGGQPILVEKPLTLNLTETIKLCEMAVNSTTPLMCGFVERFNPAITAARKVVQGPVSHLTAIRHSPHPARATTGVVEDLLIHDLDLVLQFFFSESEVKGVAIVQPKLARFDEIAEVSLTGLEGQIAHLSTSRWGQRKIRHWTISTDHQTVEVDLLQQTIVAYENINQEVGPSGGASYRTRTVIDYPFIERSGEPLSLQLAYFSALLNDHTKIRNECFGIVKTHQALETILSR